MDGAEVVVVVPPHEAITRPTTNSRIRAAATIQRRVIRMRRPPNKPLQVFADVLEAAEARSIADAVRRTNNT